MNDLQCLIGVQPLPRSFHGMKDIQESNCVHQSKGTGMNQVHPTYDTNFDGKNGCIANELVREEASLHISITNLHPRD